MENIPDETKSQEEYGDVYSKVDWFLTLLVTTAHGLIIHSLD